MLLQPSPISSDLFCFKNNTFIAEASDLQDTVLGQVYDDACDEGFTIISKKTGKPAVFAMNEIKRDREGDLVSWEFVCVTPGLKALKAVIFND